MKFIPAMVFYLAGFLSALAGEIGLFAMWMSIGSLYVVLAATGTFGDD